MRTILFSPLPKQTGSLGAKIFERLIGCPTEKPLITVSVQKDKAELDSLDLDSNPNSTMY